MTDKSAQDRNLEAVMTMAANGILGNWDIVRPFVADDIVLHVPQSLPWGGDSHGWEGYQQALITMGQFFAVMEVEDVTFTPEDDSVIIRLIVKGQVAATGKTFAMPLLEVWRVKDTKVFDITAFFFDTKELCDG